ncbi:MAG TPA: EamA family transporter [Solirubrobacteraceae bacterium]|nr:EamA family transporter [Solirubrobacteraceae bacterium]
MSSLAALASALFIGSADFFGGWASRKASNLPVTMWLNIVAFTVMAIACAIVQPRLSLGHAIGALAGGCVSAVSINLIYAAFSAGAMSLTAPLIACGSAIVPTVAATVAGQPPDSIQSVGIAVTLVGVVAITWMPRASPAHLILSRRALGLTVLASFAAGAALAIMLLSAKGSTSAVVGVSALSRLTSSSTCFLFVVISRGRVKLPRSLAPVVVGTGLLEAAGATLFLLASSLGNTAVVAVLVSLFSIVTVLLAQVFLRERIATRQGWGIAVAAAGVALLSAG